MSIGYVVVVQRLHSDAYGLGAGPNLRLPVIPSPRKRGHGAVRVQHAGSIKTATTPRSGGQTIALRQLRDRARAASEMLTPPRLADGQLHGESEVNLPGV